MAPQSPWSPVRALLATAVVTVLLLGLAGCRGDEGPTATPGGIGGRRDGETTDPSSRYLDASGPLGGLTVETPPVGAENRPAVTPP